MADTGLQNIKLQDGYVKLLHAKSNDGVNDFLTQIGTSNGPNIVPTPLYLGNKGENLNQNPMAMMRGVDSLKPFFVISDSIGTPTDSTDNVPILTFVNDGQNTGTDYWGTSLNRARGVWNGKCMYNFAEGGNRSAIEFMCHSSSDALTSTGNGVSVFPTIRKAASGNSVMHAMPYGTTDYWQFDRIKIAADTGSSGQGSAGAGFLADGVDGAWGKLTADGYYHGVSASVSAAAGKTVDINASGSLAFISASDTTFQNGANDTFEAYGNQFLTLQADGSGNDGVGAVVALDAYRLQGGGGTSQINIGTADTQSKDFGIGSTTMSGTQTIQIGNAGIGGNSYVNANETLLNSKHVIVNSGMLVMDTAESGWSAYDDLTSPADYGALYFQSSSYTVDSHSDYGRQLFLYDDDNSSPALYTIDKTEVGKSKVLELRECSAITGGTTTTIPAVTTLPEGAAQIYVKNKKLIIAYHDANEAEASFFYIDLDTQSNPTVTWSQTEPA